MSNSNPIVAIRCITYNHSKFIRQCLDGFVKQRTNFPFVAIVHDDASVDGTADIIKEYAAKYSNLIKPIFETENQYSKSPKNIRDIMNRAIAATGAKYVALCEGDDYWTDPYKLQKQVDFLESNPDFVACFHNALIYDGHTYSLFNSMFENQSFGPDDIISRGWFISTQTLMYRQIPLNWPLWSGEIRNGDYLLELLLAREGKFYYMFDVMAVYRQEGQGVSVAMNRNLDATYDSLIRFLSMMKDYFDGAYADSFDLSISRYEQQKKSYIQDVFYDNHPLLKLFRPKTYKRMIKRWLLKRIGK